MGAETFASLRTRNFRLFFIGQSISNSGNWLTIIALTLLVLDRTGSGTAVGLLSACQFGPILVLSPWAGVLVDRSDRRRLLFVTQTLEMVQSVVLAVLAFSHPPVVALFACALAGGCLLAFDNPGRRSFVTDMVPPEQVPNAVRLYSAIVSVSSISGPALGGVLIVTVGFGWCFVIDAISYGAVLLMLRLMRPNELQPATMATRGRGQVRAGIRYLRTVPELKIGFLMLAVIGILAYNLTVTLPLFVVRHLHGSEADFTVVYALLSVGALLGALAMARRRSARLSEMVLAAAAYGAAILVLSASPNLVVTDVVVVMVGAASAAYMTAMTALVQVRADPLMRGRVLALQTVLFLGTAPLGSPLLGFLANAIGGAAPLVLGGSATLIAALLGWRAGQRVTAVSEESSAPEICCAQPEISPQPHSADGSDDFVTRGVAGWSPASKDRDLRGRAQGTSPRRRAEEPRGVFRQPRDSSTGHSGQPT